MRNIKHIAAFFIILFVSTASFATGGMTLFLKIKGAEKTEKYSLAEDKPVVTFDGKHVLIKTSTVEVATPYTYAEVEKFYFEMEEDILPSPEPEEEEKPDAIDDIRDDAKQKVSFEFAYDGRSVVMKGFGEAPKVAVFNMAGVRMQPHTEVSSDRVAISMYELPKGIYVIRANDRSFKIIKK